VHFLNAWTSGTQVHIDGCRLDQLDLGLESDDGSLGENGSYLTRWTVDLATGSVREERIAELPGEFPRVADAVAGLDYRYGYVPSGATGKQKGGEFDCIVKYDFERDATRVHHFGPEKVCGEAVFAADPKGGGEDAGWLLTYLIDRRDRSTEVLVLDARDVAAEPVARIALPRRVPFGFHGSWLPAGA
jgi:carotenoid cleavage dioxygenase